MVTDSVGLAVGSADPEFVTGFLVPQRYAHGSALLDDQPRLRMSMYRENAHRNLVDTWDPDHSKLAWTSVMEGGVAEPERADRWGFILDSLHPDRTRRVH